MSHEIVVIDIEGCLTIKKGAPLPLMELYALQKAKASVPFALCTGRPQPYAEAIIQILGPNAFLRPSIVENGCFLYDPRKETLFPHPLIKGLGESFREIRRFLEVRCPEAPVEPGKELCISLTLMEGERIEELFQKVQGLLESFREKISIAHSNSAVDITPKGIDKGAGMLFLCKHTGIPWENVIAIGDSNNDIPVLSLAGYSACPSNSKGEVIDLVREKGGYVAKAAYAEGVTEILRHYRVIS